MRTFGQWPVAADAHDHGLQHLRDLLTRRPLAGPQQRDDGLAGRRFEDVDRLEAMAAGSRRRRARALRRVEEGELLAAVNHVAGVVDVEFDAVRRALVA